MLKTTKKKAKTSIYRKGESSKKSARNTQGVVAKRKNKTQHVAPSMALSKSEIALLVELRAFLQIIGLGDRFGYLGRNQAILHHELLHDDPNCRVLDEKGYKKCVLRGFELRSLCELCDNEASILEFDDSNFVKRIDALLARHCPKGKGVPSSSPFVRKSNPKLHPNYAMLPELPPSIDTSLLSGGAIEITKSSTKGKEKKHVKR